MTRYILNDEEEADYRRARRHISPSRLGSEHWEGSYRQAERYSEEQKLAMAHDGRDLVTADFVEVIAPAQNRLYITVPWGLSSRMLESYSRRLACPIVGKRGDRLLVISPSGTKKLVYPNGSLTRPRARRAA